MVTFRAIRAHGRHSAALFATGVLVIAGGLVAVAFARLAHTSTGSAAALLLVGGVALASQATASVRARRQEISLAQLRGARGLRLLVVAVAEPCAVLVAAAVAGTAVGWLVARLAVRHWLAPGTPFDVTVAEWAAVGLMWCVSAAIVVVVSWRTAYEPLNAKLDSQDRPRPPSSASLFLSLLVIVAAIVSVYQAQQAGPRRADWVGLLSPALVGLAAGQIGIWVVVSITRMATAAGGSADRLGWFLTVRRLTRRADSVSVVRVVVAAVVMAGVAASAWAGSGVWRDQMARVETVGPLQVTVPAGGLRAYAASHAADPKGDWLIAMSATPDASGGSYRDVFVDTPRWDRVVGPFFAGTPVANVSSEIGALLPAHQNRLARGSTFSVRFTARSVRRSWPGRLLRRIAGTQQSAGFVPLQFTVRFVDDHGNSQTLQVPAKPGRPPAPVGRGVVGYSTSITGCARACAVAKVYVQGLTRAEPLVVTSMSFGNLELMSAGDDGMALPGPSRAVRAIGSRAGMDLELGGAYLSHALLGWGQDALPAAIATPGLRPEVSRGHPQAYGLDGVAWPVRVTGQATALPLLGRVGLLLDLGTALRGAEGQIPLNESVVVARADTPPAVMDKLRAAGVDGPIRTVQQTLARIDRTQTAQGTQLYALIAVFALLIAAISVMSSTAQQRRERSTEAAALRVVGVKAGQVARGYRGEAWALGLVVAISSGLGAWVGCRALLASLPLVDPGQFGVPFDAKPELHLVVGQAVGSGLFVALVVWVAFRRVGRSSAPMLLREEAR